MLFLVKVQIDLQKMTELGQKLASGELDMSPIQWTVCYKENPSIGISIWQATDEDDFHQKFASHKEYYSKIIEISSMLTPDEAMKALN